MKTKSSKTKMFLWKFSPIIHSTTYHYQKAIWVNLRRKSHWGPWSSWGSPLIALSLVFTIIRVLFRFLIERILFKVLSDRVFFESSEIGSSSIGHAVIDSYLHQCSFSAMSLFFYQIVLLLFYQKQMLCFVFIIILKNSLTCSNNFRKTDSEKNEEIHNRDTKCYIEKICHQFPDLCNQIPSEFHLQEQPPAVFFK